MENLRLAPPASSAAALTGIPPNDPDASEPPPHITPGVAGTALPSEPVTTPMGTTGRRELGFSRIMPEVMGTQ